MALWRITNTFFTGLINRLGVRPPPRDGFSIQDIIVPVTLVDADISLPQVPTTPLFDVGQFITAGETSAPALGTRLANTTAQPAGNYTAVIFFNAGESNSWRIRRRNAGDTADVWAYRTSLLGSTTAYFSFRLTLAANESLVVENVVGGGAGVVYQAVIILVPS